MRPTHASQGTKNKYEIRGDHAAIFLTDKYGNVCNEVLVDTCDLERIVGHARWCRQVGKTTTYAVNRNWNSTPRKTYLHRFIIGDSERCDVDHINGNGLDCRRANLRAITRTKNSQNRVRRNKNNTSGYRNVSWCSRVSMWVVQLVIDGNYANFGYFKDLEQAAKVAADARRTHLTHCNENSL